MRIKYFHTQILLKILIALAIAAVFIFSGVSCSDEFSAGELEYIAQVKKDRLEKDSIMQHSETSPFNFKGKVDFHPLNYFDVDPAFKFESKLYEYEKKDTIVIFGTKGDERRPVRFGYVAVNYDRQEHKIHVYEGNTISGEKYYMIWFTDKTTNDQSYGVGRYLNFEKQDDPNFIYTIDFNEAYNPYCAYTKDYSCSIPSIDDYIDMAITAGEKKFHE